MWSCISTTTTHDFVQRCPGQHSETFPLQVHKPFQISTFVPTLMLNYKRSACHVQWMHQAVLPDILICLSPRIFHFIYLHSESSGANGSIVHRISKWLRIHSRGHSHTQTMPYGTGSYTLCSTASLAKHRDTSSHKASLSNQSACTT